MTDTNKKIQKNLENDKILSKYKKIFEIKYADYIKIKTMFTILEKHFYRYVHVIYKDEKSNAVILGVIKLEFEEILKINDIDYRCSYTY